LHIPTHILSGWCIGNCFSLTPRERLLCMVAASVSDLDGFGWFVSRDMYWRYHHVLGHGLAVGVAFSLVAAWFSSHRVKAFWVYLSLFHLHLLMDFFGSGIGWPIYYWWPFNQRAYITHYAWSLTSWQNYLAFGVLLIWTYIILRTKRRSPLELLAPRLDRVLVKQRAGGTPVEPTKG
jgi:hypothetical protein